MTFKINNLPLKPSLPSGEPLVPPIQPRGKVARGRLPQATRTSLGQVLRLIDPPRRARLLFAARVREELRTLGVIGDCNVTLFDRVKDFGGAQLLALGAMALVTTVANQLVSPAFAAETSQIDAAKALVALSGPVAEKLPMLLIGLKKVPKSFERHGLAFRLTLGATLALPNTITDVVFHDSAYTKLTYEGLVGDFGPEWLVAGGAWGAAFAFAVLAQHAVVLGVRRLSR